MHPADRRNLHGIGGTARQRGRFLSVLTAMIFLFIDIRYIIR
jgi:hypothetical protein